MSFVCCSSLLYAQVDSTAIDSVAVIKSEMPKDSLTEKLQLPILSSVSLIFDYGKLASGLILETEAKYDASVQVEFYNEFFLTGEFGLATLEPREGYINANYMSEGSYWRIGLGYKLDMSPKFNFMFGLRYGQASFRDGGKVIILSQSGLFEPYEESFDRQNLSAHWYALVMSSESRIWKGLYVGFHTRLKFIGDYDKQIPLDVYTIPGYGRTIDIVPAINLYVKYALELF